MTGNRPNIALLGFMGTGKTRVGRLLADRTGMTFIDMDDIIEQRAGKPITRIFAEDGEPAFRAMERDLARELARPSGLVIGAGGGVVLNPDNVRDLERGGLAVCLKAAPDVLLSRLGGDTTRPLLAGGDKGRRILELLAARRPLYDAIAHQVDTTHLTVEQVAERILAMRKE